MKIASRKNHTSRTNDSSDSLIRAIEYIGDNLVVAAADFMNAKGYVFVGDWRRAKTRLEKGFSEFVRHADHRDAILARLAKLQRRAKSRKRGG